LPVYGSTRLAVKSLTDLNAFKKDLAAQAAAQSAHAATRQQRQVQIIAQAQAAHATFTQAVGTVKPLKTTAKMPFSQGLKNAPITAEAAALARARATQAAPDERIGAMPFSNELSDEWDASRLITIDPVVGYRRPGVGSDVLRQLQRGLRQSQAQLDLHGLNVDAARSALAHFIERAKTESWRCLRIVHGQGHSSPGQRPVLKNKVHSWLVQTDAVQAFAQAPAKEGGAGAVLVLLR
jgi:DNA-nicking Smr family endonuclease